MCQHYKSPKSTPTHKPTLYCKHLPLLYYCQPTNYRALDLITILVFSCSKAASIKANLDSNTFLSALRAARDVCTRAVLIVGRELIMASLLAESGKPLLRLDSGPRPVSRPESRAVPLVLLADSLADPLAEFIFIVSIGIVSESCVQ